jgi:hypothetical protein
MWGTQINWGVSPAARELPGRLLDGYPEEKHGGEQVAGQAGDLRGMG